MKGVIPFRLTVPLVRVVPPSVGEGLRPSPAHHTNRGTSANELRKSTGVMAMAGLKSLQRFTRVSGASIGKNANKMVGCETITCNFMKLYDKAIEVDGVKADQMRTGSLCPLCSQNTIRIFDSRAEMQRLQELKMMVKAGVISDLKCQVRFPLYVKDFSSGKNVVLYHYIADFTYDERDHETGIDSFTVEDVKGGYVIADIAAIKLKHFAIQNGYEVKIVCR